MRKGYNPYLLPDWLRKTRFYCKHVSIPICCFQLIRSINCADHMGFSLTSTITTHFLFVLQEHYLMGMKPSSTHHLNPK